MEAFRDGSMESCQPRDRCHSVSRRGLRRGRQPLDVWPTLGRSGALQRARTPKQTRPCRLFMTRGNSTWSRSTPRDPFRCPGMRLLRLHCDGPATTSAPTPAASAGVAAAAAPGMKIENGHGGHREIPNWRPSQTVKLAPNRALRKSRAGPSRSTS